MRTSVLTTTVLLPGQRGAVPADQALRKVGPWKADSSLGTCVCSRLLGPLQVQRSQHRQVCAAAAIAKYGDLDRLPRFWQKGKFDPSIADSQAFAKKKWGH